MQLIIWDKAGPKRVEKLTAQDFDKKRARLVARIIEDVRKFGDRALIKYTKRFDEVELTSKRLRVGEGDINKAYEQMDVKFVPMLKQILDNIRSFYRKQLRKSFRLKGKDGIVLVGTYRPLRRVGIYIPGGTAPLVSTVYMTVVPAKVAGVKEIVIVSPPTKGGDIDPHILTVANLLGVKEIYRVGGAQAIAALALGTKTIKKVDKIVGPGNVWVSEAKRQVYGFCDIDMLAGPTEVVILADRYADTSFVISDLLAQSEHIDGINILITISRKLAEEIRKKVHEGYIIIVRSLKEAADVINLIAPEHLQIMIRNPSRVIKRIENFGACFIGPYSPATVGDYVAGPSHVLPTGGTARFYSALGVDDFIRRSHLIKYTKEALEKVRDQIGKLAEIEGLELHKGSIEARFQVPRPVEEEKNPNPVPEVKVPKEAPNEEKGVKEEAEKEDPDKKGDERGQDQG